MSEQTSRDEAVRVGAAAASPPNPTHLRAAVARALDATHEAGLISYRDEWEQVGWHCGRGAGLRDCTYDRQCPECEPAFGRRVSFEAGEEVNEEPGR